MSEEKCLFCKILTGDIPSEKVMEDDDFYAFRDINPQAPEHVLIIPRKHIEKVSDITEADVILFGRMLLFAKKLAEKLKVEEGSYRLVFNNGKLSGQEVYHVHMHLLAGRQMQWPPG